jgi:hypothetical protein
MTEIDSIALFRLSVLGPMVSRERLERGELQQLIRQLAQREYAIPNSQRSHLGEKTIEAWYYAWRQGGIDGLTPKVRVDRGQSKLPQSLQEKHRPGQGRCLNDHKQWPNAYFANLGLFTRSAAHQLARQSRCGNN